MLNNSKVVEYHCGYTHIHSEGESQKEVILCGAEGDREVVEVAEIFALPEGDILLQPSAEGAEVQLFMVTEIGLGFHTEHRLIHPTEGVAPAYSITIKA